MILGDCLDVMVPSLAKQDIQLMVADLPYQITSLNWDKKICVNKLYSRWRLMRTASSPAVFFANLKLLRLLIDSLRKEFRYELIWAKARGTNGLLAKKKPVPAHEYIGLFGNSTIYYNPIKEMSDAVPRIRTQRPFNNIFRVKDRRDASVFSSDATRYPLSVRQCASDHLSRSGAAQNKNTYYHPSQKPVKLLRWIIDSYTPAGASVLDPCSGSASSAIAALSSGRNIICIEKDPTYFDASVERVRKHVVDKDMDVTVEVRR